MTDALKLAEEALEECKTYISLYELDADGPHACEAPIIKADYEKCENALTALRTARAEWGWRPIAEMAEFELGGVRIGYHGFASWVMAPYTAYRRGQVPSIYTHFYRPQLPPPPAREEVGNG